jgi:Tfp pilus assembly major pilin PilA
MKIDVTVNVYHHGLPGGLPPTPDTRTILAAISALGASMSTQSIKLAAAVAALVAKDEDLKTEVEAILADDTANRQNVADAVRNALAAEGVEEDTIADTISTVNDAMDKNTASIKALLSPPAPALTVDPTSISGTANSGVSATLNVSGGTPPYSFVSSLADISVDSNGVVSGSPTAAETGSIAVGDAAGGSATVSVSIADAPAP